ncbi:CRP-like cAMP-binding protein [Methylobacterium sp. RAS18]|nr:CRP-like cAMP-binding protein [Methylobacterium sp. RAS18]
MIIQLDGKLKRRFLLSAADTEALTRASASERLIPAHEDLISEGINPDYAHLIQQGFACFYKILLDGGSPSWPTLSPATFAT